MIIIVPAWAAFTLTIIGGTALALTVGLAFDKMAGN